MYTAVDSAHLYKIQWEFDYTLEEIRKTGIYSGYRKFTSRSSLVSAATLGWACGYTGTTVNSLFTHFTQWTFISLISSHLISSHLISSQLILFHLKRVAVSACAAVKRPMSAWLRPTSFWLVAATANWVASRRTYRHSFQTKWGQLNWDKVLYMHSPDARRGNDTVDFHVAWRRCALYGCPLVLVPIIVDFLFRFCGAN